MGLNTAVLILNDALGSAQADPKGFAENLLEAVREHGQGRVFPHGRL